MSTVSFCGVFLVRGDADEWTKFLWTREIRFVFGPAFDSAASVPVPGGNFPLLGSSFQGECTQIAGLLMASLRAS